MKAVDLREQMPLTAAFIDALRQAFGVEGIHEHIRAGMRGEPDRFYARENGIEIGVQFTVGTSFEHDGSFWRQVAATVRGS